MKAIARALGAIGEQITAMWEDKLYGFFTYMMVCGLVANIQWAYAACKWIITHVRFV